MDERPCIRGCVYRGRHLHTCPEASGAARLIHAIFGSAERCNGCEPVPAADSALICERDIRVLRRNINDAPDLCSHLRSLIDPQKAQVYDQEKLGGKPPSESQPPMSADLVDAADEVLAILTYFAEVFGDEMTYTTHTIPAGTDSEQAYYLARTPAWYLLENLPGIVNDVRVVGFARVVIDCPADEDPKAEILWTIAKAARRWPLHERGTFSKLPCPRCEKRVVFRRPPRVEGEEVGYECRDEACGWVPPAEETVLWAVYFEGVAA